MAVPNLRVGNGEVSTSVGASPPICTFYTPEYSGVVEGLKKSANALGYEFVAIRMPSEGSWVKNCALKAKAVRELLRTYKEFWFVDADMRLKEKLISPEEDFAIRQQEFFEQKPRYNSYKKYRYFMDRYGSRFMSGLMFFRKSEEVIRMVDRWVELSETCPDEWDEYHLKIAYDEDPFPFYSLSHQDLNHNSQTHDILFDRKVLLIGSAPDAKLWVEKNVKDYVEHGYAVIGVNNGWKYVPENYLMGWIAPNDFKGDRPPIHVPYLNREGSEWNRYPHWDYEIQTMFVHSVFHLINDAIKDNCRLVLHVVGFDMDYDQKGNFSLPDPLRFGEARLSRALTTLGRVVRSRGFLLANAGGHEPSRLSYRRVTSPKEITLMEEPTDVIEPLKITEEEAKSPNWRADRDLYFTAQGQVVEADNPLRKRLFVRAGDQVLMTKTLGLGIVSTGKHTKDHLTKDSKPVVEDTPKEKEAVTVSVKKERKVKVPKKNKK